MWFSCIFYSRLGTDNIDKTWNTYRQFVNLLEIMPLEIKIKDWGPKLTAFACFYLVFEYGIYFVYSFDGLMED